MGEPSRTRTRRGSYREPTPTGLIETVGSNLWGAGMAGERSDLHKVLFVSLGGTLEQWDLPAGQDSQADVFLRVSAAQADAVLEWLAGRDRMRR